MNSQTLGQKRVKAEFNPAKNEVVDQIKNKSAELIDLLESMRIAGTHSQTIYGEKHRFISIAQTEIPDQPIFYPVLIPVRKFGEWYNMRFRHIKKYKRKNK